MFSLCPPLRRGGGVTEKGYRPPTWTWKSVNGVLPSTPPGSGKGYPPPFKTGWDIPHPRLDGVPIQSKTGSGTTPPPPVRRQSSIVSTRYVAGGMPLAFTQEDFLVWIDNKKILWSLSPVNMNRKLFLGTDLETMLVSLSTNVNAPLQCLTVKPKNCVFELCLRFVLPFALCNCDQCLQRQ